MQRGKWQIKLRLNTCRAEYPHTRGCSNGIIEKYGLTRAGPAPQNQYAAAGGARAIEQCGDCGPFEVPSIQHQISNLDTNCGRPVVAAHDCRAPALRAIPPHPAISPVRPLHCLNSVSTRLVWRWPVRTDMEFMNRLFHAVLRRDLVRVIGSLTASRRPSPAQRAALAEHVGLVLDLLHHHHTREDIGPLPLVRRRAPD